jgi:hypothetical protein
MKIIAKKTKENGFIVDVNANEMANILGFNQLQEIDRSQNDLLAEGSEIDIQKVYKAYREVDVQKLRDTIADLQKIVTTLTNKVAGLPNPAAEQALPARRKVTVPEQQANQQNDVQRAMEEIFRMGRVPADPPEEENVIPWQDNGNRPYFDGSLGGRSIYTRDDASNLDQ